jgi:uncharacterized protein involved in outer membrane biogenesis
VTARTSRLVAVVAGVLVVLLAAGYFALSRYVRSDAFRARVLATAGGALGTDVRVDALRVSLFRGVVLEGVAIANPAGFGGDLATARALTIRFRLWPLLRRRLEMDEVVLDRPVVRLARGEARSWNYESLGPAPAPGSRPPAPPGAPGANPPAAPGSPRFSVLLPALALRQGDLLLAGERGRPLARVEGLDLATSVRWTPLELAGEGSTRIATLSVGNALFLRQLSAPLAFGDGRLRLAPVSATLADGAVGGDLTLTLAGRPRYAATLEVRDADVERLLREAGSARRLVRGRLQARATLAGTGGLGTVAGQGHAELVDGALLDLPLLQLLGNLLKVPALRDLAFHECRVDFTLADGILRTPSIRVAARDLQITGSGQVVLDGLTLDHRFTLAVPRDVVARAPREVREAFTARPDGLMAVDFRVWGPYDAPRTDLTDRVLRGAAQDLLIRGLRRLLR